MSIEWRYESSSNDGNIELIYCSNIEMTIPVQYFWNVLLKDGREYDLTSPQLGKIIKFKIDLDALKLARENYLYLHSINVS